MTYGTPGFIFLMVVVTFAVMVHIFGMIDAALTYRDLRESEYRDRAYLRVLAIGGIRTAFFRFSQQVILLHMLLKVPPDRIQILWGIMAVCAISIVKELWAVYDRHRTHQLWEQHLHTSVRNTFRDS